MDWVLQDPKQTGLRTTSRKWEKPGEVKEQIESSALLRATGAMKKRRDFSCSTRCMDETLPSKQISDHESSWQSKIA